MKKLLYVTLLLTLISCSENTEKRSAATGPDQKIREFCSPYQAQVGVAVIGPDLKDTFLWNGNEHFPMQSVFKFHIVATMLHAIDQERFTMDQYVVFKPADLLEHTWSPLNEKYNPGDSATLKEIMEYTVSLSDNNGCDILLRMLGGTQAVQAFINSIGIRDFAINTNEEQMHRDSLAQFTNWTTPLAATRALIRLYHNDPSVLDSAGHRFLWDVMFATSTGQQRLKGKLPAGTRVAHKTGSSGRNGAGIVDAANDIGVVILADGKPVFISVLVSASRESDSTNDHIISGISEIIWDHYTSSVSDQE
ncbi:MAG: class A beta-lactamase [Taibaiella sp.]|nr:class A beta-lactamase [Taibaiella sp.]